MDQTILGGTMTGKGDKRRPKKVDDETFADNWERIFGKKDDKRRTTKHSDRDSSSKPRA